MLKLYKVEETVIKKCTYEMLISQHNLEITDTSTLNQSNLSEKSMNKLFQIPAKTKIN